MEAINTSNCIDLNNLVNGSNLHKCIELNNWTNGGEWKWFKRNRVGTYLMLTWSLFGDIRAQYVMAYMELKTESWADSLAHFTALFKMSVWFRELVKKSPRLHDWLKLARREWELLSHYDYIRLGTCEPIRKAESVSQVRQHTKLSFPGRWSRDVRPQTGNEMQSRTVSGAEPWLPWLPLSTHSPPLGRHSCLQTVWLHQQWNIFALTQVSGDCPIPEQGTECTS